MAWLVKIGLWPMMIDKRRERQSNSYSSQTQQTPTPLPVWRRPYDISMDCSVRSSSYFRPQLTLVNEVLHQQTIWCHLLSLVRYRLQNTAQGIEKKGTNSHINRHIDRKEMTSAPLHFMLVCGGPVSSPNSIPTLGCPFIVFLPLDY